MTQLNQIWKCEICGNIVEVVHSGADSLVCDEQPMKLFKEQTKKDEPKLGEKHVPVISGRKVKIGSVEHPMLAEHYIECIEAVSASGERARKFLRPGDKPETEFCFNVVSARELCNLHGFWKA